MNNTGIKPKESKSGSKFYNEMTRRYVFFPLHNLKFGESQFTSPVWNPKMPKGRFILLEPCEFVTNISDENSQDGNTKLGEKIMGTDAQVSFLMGSSDGAGFAHKGMSYLQSLTNATPEIVVEIEKLVLPEVDGEIFIPKTMQEFAKLVKEKQIPDSPLKETAEATRLEVLDGLDRAYKFCMNYTRELESELANAKLGRAGIRALEPIHMFYFEAIAKPLPEDREGTNMGNELARVLAPLIQGQGTIPPDTREKDAELELLKQKLSDIEDENTVLRKLVEEEEETGE